MQSTHERGSATIGVQRQLVTRHGMFGHRVDEQCFELAGTFGVLGASADNAPFDKTAAIDIEDDVEIEPGPFHRPHQLADVPGPDLVGCLGQQVGFLTDRMAALATAFGNLSLSGQYPIHRTDPAQAGAFVEQGGKDPGQRLIGEAGCAQMGKHLNPFTFRQGTR